MQPSLQNICIFGFARLGRNFLELSTSAGPFARLQVLTDAILLHCHTLKGYSRNSASYQAVPYANVVPDGQQRSLSTAYDVTIYMYICWLCCYCCCCCCGCCCCWTELDFQIQEVVQGYFYYFYYYYSHLKEYVYRIHWCPTVNLCW